MLAKRVGVVGVADNSNWPTQHTMFVSSLPHYGDKDGYDANSDPTDILAYGASHDSICRGYAISGRVPRADSAIAVIGSASETIATHVGTLIGDVYSNESTPVLIKSQTDFFNSADTNNPAQARYANESGAAIGSGFTVWSGASGNTAGQNDCANWTTKIPEDGNILSLGQSSNPGWFYPGILQINPCENTNRLLCLTK